MPYPLEDKLVIAIASSALFDLEDSDRVFREQGLKAYREYQRTHQNETLQPAAIESACAAASRTGKVRRSGDFLWRPDMREAPLRDRSEAPEALKKVELIAPEELAAAIEKVVADSFGMDRGEVPAAVLRLLLGFRRTTETAQQQVMRVLDGMVARRELNQEGSHVSLPD